MSYARLTYATGGTYGGLALGGLLGGQTTGTVSATAYPLLGNVGVTVTWSGPPYVRLSRVVAGVRTPVRGAYPLPLPAGVFTDGDAPLDVAITYEATAPGQAFVAVSSPVTLAGQGGTWLSHPTLGPALRVIVTREPGAERAIQRGVHRILGRVYPVAVSADQRESATGTLQVMVETFAQRDALWALLDDGQPLLLRSPPTLGHGVGEWLSIGDVALAALGHGAWEAPRILSLPYQVVDTPASNLDEL